MPAGLRTLLAYSSLVFLATACATPEQRRRAELDALRSWRATLQLTSEALAGRRIPSGYARQVLQAAREHERAHQTGPEWQSISPSMKREFTAAAERLAAELGEPPASTVP